MTDFDNLLVEVKNGLEGKGVGIPISHKRLGQHIGIKKGIMTLIFSSTGAGKSSFVDDTYILGTFDYWKANGGVKPVPILLSAERSKKLRIAKWLCFRIFKTSGISITIPKLLSWYIGHTLTKDEHDLVIMQKDYMDELIEFCHIKDGSDNPTGYWKYIKTIALERGKVEKVSEFHSVYIPNNPNEILIPIYDHLNITKTERGWDLRNSIAKLSEYIQEQRDFYGMAPVAVAQLNRDMNSVTIGGKSKDIEPTVDQIKDCSDPANAADVVISIFDPIRYKTTDPHYEAEKFINQQNGNKHFRSIKILKNSYGSDGIRIGMGFWGATGQFVELPKADEVTDKIYDDIISGRHFLDMPELKQLKQFKNGNK